MVICYCVVNSLPFLIFESFGEIIKFFSFFLFRISFLSNNVLFQIIKFTFQNFFVFIAEIHPIRLIITRFCVHSILLLLYYLLLLVIIVIILLLLLLFIVIIIININLCITSHFISLSFASLFFRFGPSTEFILQI